MGNENTSVKQSQMPPVQQPEVKAAEPVAPLVKLSKEAVEAAKARGVSDEVIKAFESGKPVKVVATTKGIYPNCVRRKRGDEFRVSKLEDFSPTWHELKK